MNQPKSSPSSAPPPAKSENIKEQADITNDIAQLSGQLKPLSEEAKGQWSVEVLSQVQDIKPSQFHPERKWMATHFQITQPDGKSMEIPSTQVMLTITSKDGTKIEVPAFATHHIMSLHLKGEEAGSTMTGSLESSFRSVAEHLPAKLPFGKESAAFEIDLQQATGTEGVTSQKEMLEKGIVSKEDLALLETAKETVFKLNVEGTDEEKQKFITEFNAQLAGKNLKLGIRAGAITPFFTAERQPTTKMFVVVGKEKDPDDSEHNRVWTMTPGRHMERLPTDNKFMGRLPTEGISEGTTVADILKKAESGAALSETETVLLNEQKKAQECWWNGGFIAPPEKK